MKPRKVASEKAHAKAHAKAPPKALDALPRAPHQAQSRVRRLRPTDLSPCAALVGATPLWQRYGYGAKQCRKDLASALARGDVLWVAAEGKQLRGFAWVVPRGGLGRLPYLKLLAVAPEAQGQGVGVVLLEASARQGGLMLLVSDFNAGARRFYARAGFEEAGAFPGFVLPDVAEILMWKRSAAVTRPPARPARRPAPRARAARGTRAR